MDPTSHKLWMQYAASVADYHILTTRFDSTFKIAKFDQPGVLVNESESLQASELLVRASWSGRTAMLSWAEGLARIYDAELDQIAVMVGDYGRVEQLPGTELPLMDIDAVGNAYAVDTNLWQIDKLSPDGTITRDIVTLPGAIVDLRYSGIEGGDYLYTVDADRVTVRKWDMTGTELWNSVVSAPPGVTRDTGLILDIDSGHVYFAGHSEIKTTSNTFYKWYIRLSVSTGAETSSSTQSGLTAYNQRSPTAGVIIDNYIYTVEGTRIFKHPLSTFGTRVDMGGTLQGYNYPATNLQGGRDAIAATESGKLVFSAGFQPEFFEMDVDGTQFRALFDRPQLYHWALSNGRMSAGL